MTRLRPFTKNTPRYTSPHLAMHSSRVHEYAFALPTHAQKKTIQARHFFLVFSFSSVLVLYTFILTDKSDVLPECLSNQYPRDSRDSRIGHWHTPVFLILHTIIHSAVCSFYLWPPCSRFMWHCHFLYPEGRFDAVAI